MLNARNFLLKKILKYKKKKIRREDFFFFFPNLAAGGGGPAVDDGGSCRGRGARHSEWVLLFAEPLDREEGSGPAQQLLKWRKFARTRTSSSSSAQIYPFGHIQTPPICAALEKKTSAAHSLTCVRVHFFLTRDCLGYRAKSIHFRVRIIFFLGLFLSDFFYTSSYSL